MGLMVTVTRKDEFDVYSDPSSPGHDGNGYFYFRISRPPKKLEVGTPVWVVYQGTLRGYHQLHSVVQLTEETAKSMPQVSSGGRQGGWKPGAYLARHASTWHPLAGPSPMKGFRGFRYTQEASPAA